MNSEISFKTINKLAIPALISGVSEPILSLTDAAIVGNTTLNPTAALAAVGIVTTFLSMLIWVLGQTRSAISSIISQHLGANKLQQVKNLPAQAIFIITALSVLIILISYPLASPIFKLYNASNTILDYCVTYYQIRVFGFPFTLFTIAIFGTFRGLQNTYYPMIIASIGALINIILDILLVYGFANIIPELHIKGAAYASLISQVIMAGLAAYYLLKKTPIPLKLTRPFNSKIKSFVLMILNLFVRTLSLNVTLYFATKFATGYGESYIAAYTIGINLWFFGAFIIDGYASAGNILSGKFYGQNAFKNLITLSYKLIRYGTVLGFILALLGAIFYTKIGTIFTKDPDVLLHFNSVFWLILIMQPFCAISFIFDGIFKGLGKMKALRNLLLVSTFLVFIPALFILDYYNLKLSAIFIAIGLWIIARGFPLIIKFRREFLPRAQKQ